MINWIISIGVSCGALSFFVGPVTAILIAAARAERKRIEAEKAAEMLPSVGQVTLRARLSPAQVSIVPEKFSAKFPLFDVERVKYESKGLIIIGDQGSAKTSIAQYICQFFPEYSIIVFDLHDDDETKDAWGNAARVVGIQNIYEQMRIILDCLEQKDKSKLIVICDEWLEIRHHEQNKSGDYKGLADKFIRLFSTKTRKFNKLGMFILHSPNVEAAGVDSYLRENYLKIHLGRLATKEFPSLIPVAYPCAIEGEQCIHPTHGHHEFFAPLGKTPKNLLGLNCPPVTIPVAGQENLLRQSTRCNVRQQLETLYQCEPSTLASEPSSLASERTNRERTGSEPKLEPLQGLAFSDCEPGHEPSSEPQTEPVLQRYTALHLTEAQVRTVVRAMKFDHTQIQIIEKLWNCSKGGGKAYKQARAQYLKITGE